VFALNPPVFVFVGNVAGKPLVALVDTALCGIMGNELFVLVLMGSSGFTLPPREACPPCCA
jgi:hypothetical protein